MRYLGFGLGLRACHYDDILRSQPKVDWFEIITEDYLSPGAENLMYLERIRAHYPMVMHGLSLSMGGTDPLDMSYLAQVKSLASRIEAQWVSDHLCWTHVEGTHFHDLLPVPYTEEALLHIAERVAKAQDFLGRALLVENPSSYISFKEDEMLEWEFLNALVEKTGCKLLLDINNIYVSAFNHGFDADEYVSNIRHDAVQQFHLAGHRHKGTHIIDTHDDVVIDAVWDLYAKAVKRFGKVSTMIEWDSDIPALDVLLGELDKARARSDVMVAPLPDPLPEGEGTS